jgi:hypothetical protein
MATDGPSDFAFWSAIAGIIALLFGTVAFLDNRRVKSLDDLTKRLETINGTILEIREKYLLVRDYERETKESTAKFEKIDRLIEMLRQRSHDLAEEIHKSINQ